MYVYPQELSITNSHGIPKDSLAFYFPISSQFSGLDTFKMNWFSSALYCAKEPILYNFYLDQDIYRFLWLRSFYRPIILSIYKKGEKVWLVTKELDKQPQFMDDHNVGWVSSDFFGKNTLTTSMVKDTMIYIDTVIKADRKAEITINQTKQLSIKEWEEFESLINKFSFWKSKPLLEDSGCDGSEWTIEGHLKNRYWYVSRWSPKDSIKEVGLWLIAKSGLKEEVY